MEIKEDNQELQLLPSTTLYPSSSQIPRWGPFGSSSTHTKHYNDDNKHNFEDPSLDLQLSICDRVNSGHAWQTREQIQIAALEYAYLERIKELTRREMELAESEFSRARLMWIRTIEDVDKAEKMKEKAVHWINPTCMEITCQSCGQKFTS